MFANLTKKILLVLLAITLLTGLAGCGQSTTPESQAQTTSSELTGKITVSGAFALYPMMVRWGEEFQKLHRVQERSSERALHQDISAPVQR